MNTLSELLLLCGIQTLVISIVLLIGITLLRCSGRRRSTTLVSAGLTSMLGFWLVACLPIEGWLAPQRLFEPAEQLAGSPETDVGADRPAARSSRNSGGNEVVRFNVAIRLSLSVRRGHRLRA